MGILKIFRPSFWTGGAGARVEVTACSGEATFIDLPTGNRYCRDQLLLVPGGEYITPDEEKRRQHGAEARYGFDLDGKPMIEDPSGRSGFMGADPFADMVVSEGIAGAGPGAEMGGGLYPAIAGSVPASEMIRGALETRKRRGFSPSDLLDLLRRGKAPAVALVQRREMEKKRRNLIIMAAIALIVIVFVLLRRRGLL